MNLYMKIGEAILKHEERVMRLPNIMGIGIGKCAEIIPNTLEGFLTDVEEIGVVTAQASYPYQEDLL